MKYRTKARYNTGQDKTKYRTRTRQNTGQRQDTGQINYKIQDKDKIKYRTKTS